MRRLLAYAAGLGATAAATFDDDRDGGIVAVPPFCVCLEWPVVSSPAAAGLYGTRPEESRRGVHASQDSFFHRPLRPGDEVETRGRIVAVEATRAGALTTTKLETVDAGTGEPLVTSWSRSVFRGVEVAGADEVLEAAPTVAAAGAPPGAAAVTIPVSRELPHVYTECARIWNPIHTERRVALAAGLPDIILHGTATWALAGCEILRLYADGDPAALRRLHGRFRAMVVPGSEIVLRHWRDGDAVAFEVETDAGRPAVSHGRAEIVPA